MNKVGATRQTADVASQYIPEVATSQEVTTIATTTTKPRNLKVHTLLHFPTGGANDAQNVSVDTVRGKDNDEQNF